MNIYIIAGPNGAGKTTFAAEFLPKYVDCREFLNADLIAAGLSPFSPNLQNLRASELMFERMQNLLNDKITFAIETTLCSQILFQTNFAVAEHWLSSKLDIHLASIGGVGHRAGC